MDENKNIVPFDLISQIYTGSFLTKEQAEQFKDIFKNLTLVVRCKDCKNQYDPIHCQMYSEGMKTPDDWYCADGERR